MPPTVRHRVTARVPPRAPVRAGRAGLPQRVIRRRRTRGVRCGATGPGRARCTGPRAPARSAPVPAASSAVHLLAAAYRRLFRRLPAAPTPSGGFRAGWRTIGRSATERGGGTPRAGRHPARDGASGREAARAGGGHLVGSCHLHGRGLRRPGADRSAVRAPARTSAPAPRCAAAARGRGRRRRRSSRICTPTICICPRWPGSRPAPGWWCRAGAPARGAGAAAAGRGRAAGHRGGGRATRCAVGDVVVRAVPARARRAAAAGRTAPLARARLCRRGRGADVLRRGHRAVRRRWPRRSGRSTWRCCRSAAGGRTSGDGPSGRGAGGAGAGAARAAQRGAGALRHVLADRDGRRPAARVPRAGRRVRAARRRGCAPEVAVHRLGHGERVRPEAGREPRSRTVARAASEVGAATVPPESTQQAVGYPSLFLLVAARGAGAGGADGGAGQLGGGGGLPPDGAVRAAAGVRWWRRCAAFLGDVALYWLGRRGVRSKNGSRWLEALRGRAAPEPARRRRRQKLDEHGVAVLVLSRLVPAGRIPVMLACLLAQMPLRRFVPGRHLPACLAWAATYQLIGILGGSLFAEPWEGVVAAVALTLLISVAPVSGGASSAAGSWRRGLRVRRGRSRSPRAPEGRGSGSGGQPAPVSRRPAGPTGPRRGRPAALPGGPRRACSGSRTGSADRTNVAQCIGAMRAGAEVLEGPDRLLRVACARR